jgi:hypothetical protein
MLAQYQGHLKAGHGAGSPDLVFSPIGEVDLPCAEVNVKVRRYLQKHKGCQAGRLLKLPFPVIERYSVLCVSNALYLSPPQ